MTLTPEQLADAKSLFSLHTKGCVAYTDKNDIRPGRIIWMKSGKYYFEHSEDATDMFGVSYQLWVFYSFKFGLADNAEVRDLLKVLISEAFKSGLLTPEPISFGSSKKAEEDFILNQLIPFPQATSKSRIEEAAFKSGELIAVDSISANENKSWIKQQEEKTSANFRHLLSDMINLPIPTNLMENTKVKPEPTLAESLLEEAMQKIVALKRENEILKAKQDTFDKMMLLLQIDFPRQGAWEEERTIETRIQNFLDTRHVKTSMNTHPEPGN